MEAKELWKPALLVAALLAVTFLAFQPGTVEVDGAAKTETIRHSLVDGHRGECYPFSRELKEKNISFDICINEDGLRDRSYPLEKDEEKYRIIALGDWITFGWVENDENWPYLLEQRLNLDRPEGIEVLNFGRAGLNTRREVELLERKGVRYSPDLVILQFMDNDLKNQTEIRRLAWERFNRSREKVTAEEHRDMARKVYAEQRRERLQKPKEAQLETVIDSLDQMDGMSEKHDFEVLFLYYTTYSPANYLDHLRNKTTQEYGWKFKEVDLEERDRRTAENLTHVGGWDLTYQGHIAFTDRIYPDVEKMVDR